MIRRNLHKIKMMAHRQVELNPIFQIENKEMMKLDNHLNLNKIHKYIAMLIKLLLKIIKNLYIKKRKKQKDRREWDKKNYNKEIEWKNMENNKLLELILKERILNKNLHGVWIKRNYKMKKWNIQNYKNKRNKKKY